MKEGEIIFFGDPLRQKEKPPKRQYETAQEALEGKEKKELEPLPELFKYGEMTIGKIKSEKESFEKSAQELLEKINNDEYQFRKEMQETVSEEIKRNLEKFIVLCDDAEEKIQRIIDEEKERNDQGYEINEQEIKEKRKKIDGIYEEYVRKSNELKKEQGEIIAKMEKIEVQEVKKDINEI